MSAPSVYVGSGSERFLDGTSHFLTNAKRHEGEFGNITGTAHKDWIEPLDRYNNIALWAMSCFGGVPDLVVLEDYAMGASGKVFNIAENTAILKYHLWKSKIRLVTVAPTQLKKWYQGKGNANKTAMYRKFTEFEGVDLCKLFSWKSAEIGSPIGDIVDAFALYRYGVENCIDKSGVG
jgi:hypothetical protein